MSRLGALSTGELSRPRLPAAASTSAGWRRGFEVAAAALVALPPLIVLASTQGVSEEMLLLPILACIVGVPLVGFVLLLYAASRRDARGMQAVFFALLGLVLSLQSLSAVGALGQEVFVSRHAAELDALARDVRAAPAGVRDLALGSRPQPRTAADSLRSTAEEVSVAKLRERVYRLGFSYFEPLDGGVLLGGKGLVTRSLLYQDGASDAVPAWCADADLRLVGPGWYMFRCLRRSD